ncbi:ZIP family metal transporter [Candidatus Aenigmatarchaeota archaeon]
MSDPVILSIASVIIISLISLIGIVTLLIKENALRKVLLFLVSFSAGALFSGAFIHLLPEAVEKFGFGVEISLYTLSGIVVLFVLEKLIHWRHCHVPTSKNHPHPFGYINLIGDAIHNFIDGMIIGASYLASVTTGITTTIAVILHEIPQEIGDFGVLLYAGFSKKRALMMNFLSAITAILGTIVSLVLATYVEGITMFLLPFAAGGFIYIAGSDLIPELHKEEKMSKSIIQLIFFILGMMIMYLLVFIG